MRHFRWFSNTMTWFLVVILKEEAEKCFCVLDFCRGVTPSDREEYGLLSSSKIGVVKITCHEFTFIACDEGEFLHYYLPRACSCCCCCCCQKRSIGGRRENLLMSAPIHVRSRSLWLLCPRSASSSSSRMMALSSSPTCILLLTPRR